MSACRRRCRPLWEGVAPVILNEPTPSAALPNRDQFLELIRLLGKCHAPYLVAATVLAEDLRIVDDLRREMGSFLDDMVTLARTQKYPLPESFVADARRELHEMGQLPKRLELGLLLSEETQKCCGRQAVPILALALFQVAQWMEYGASWLESVDRLRTQVDALLGDRFPGFEKSFLAGSDPAIRG